MSHQGEPRAAIEGVWSASAPGGAVDGVREPSFQITGNNLLQTGGMADSIRIAWVCGSHKQLWHPSRMHGVVGREKVSSLHFRTRGLEKSLHSVGLEPRFTPSGRCPDRFGFDAPEPV